MSTTRRSFLKSLIAAVALSPAICKLAKSAEAAMPVDPRPWVFVEDPFPPRYSLVNGEWRLIQTMIPFGGDVCVNPKWRAATHEVVVQIKHPMLDDREDARVQMIERPICEQRSYIFQ